MNNGSKSRDGGSQYLFSFLLLANCLQYMEAGAVPALLLSIANSFGMNAGQQGLLGGVVYLSLGSGGPFAGYLLRKYDHKRVIVCAVAANMLFTFLWAMTPVGRIYSTYMFIAMRFMMGLCQCIICVFLPMWTNENAPRKRRTTWMSYLQASVPCGVMLGYVVASVCVYVSQRAETCLGMLCWRWPFLVEISLLTPLYLCLYFVPAADMSVRVCQHSPTKEARRGVEDDDMASRLLGTADGESKDPQVAPEEQQQSAQRWMKLQTAEAVEEKKHRQSWRRSSMQASMFDPLATRDMVKRSYDDFALLDDSSDVFDSLAGFRWAGSSQVPSPQELRNSGSLDDYAMADLEADLRDLEEARHSTDSVGANAGGGGGVGGDALYIETALPSVAAAALPETMRYESLRELRRKSSSDDSAFHAVGTPVMGKRRSVPRDSSVSSVDGGSPIELPKHPGAAAGGALGNGAGIAMIDQPAPAPVYCRLSMSPRTNEKKRFFQFTERSPLLGNEVSSSSQRTGLFQQVLQMISKMRGVESSNDIQQIQSGQAQTQTQGMDNIDMPSDASQSGSESEDDWTDSPMRTVRSPAAATSPATSLEEDASISSKVSSVYAMLCCRCQSRAVHRRHWMRSIRALLRMPIYRNLLGAMSALYFTVTGVQYWGTKYLMVSLNAPLLLVNMLFIVCAATGPVLGVIFGGYIIDVFGGYKGSKKRVVALEIVCVLGFIGLICAFPITFCTNIYNAIIFLWLVLFFGGSILPACAGILVSIVPRFHRPTSTSLSIVVFNMFGYCLSLVLSGYVMEVLQSYEHCDEVCAMTWGFRLVLFWSGFGAFFLFNALRSAYAQLQEKEDRQQLLMKQLNDNL